MLNLNNVIINDMEQERLEKLKSVAGFLHGWLTFDIQPPKEVVQLHLDLVMEVINNYDVLDNVIECPTCKNDGREVRYDIGTYPCATCGGKDFR